MGEICYILSAAKEHSCLMLTAKDRPVNFKTVTVSVTFGYKFQGGAMSKQTVLKLLQESSGKFISGEGISGMWSC